MDIYETVSSTRTTLTYNLIRHCVYYANNGETEEEEKKKIVIFLDEIESFTMVNQALTSSS